MSTYLALGDSMSIDDYTGVPHGGAASQFFRRLSASWSEKSWEFADRTSDGCRMPQVPTDARGDVITLTIGGNDLLWNRNLYLTEGLSRFATEHERLLRAIRKTNPTAILIVGDVYHPDATLQPDEQAALAKANRAIELNCHRVRALRAPIHDTFLGHESEYLCLQIEPTLAGATAIADLFFEAFELAHTAGAL